MVNVNVFWTRPQSYYDDAPWRGRWDLDGGAFMNQASHYVDMVDWLVGPVDNVHAYTATLARDIEAEDTGVHEPATAHRRAWPRSTSRCSRTGKNFEGSITILGERGTVRIGGVAVNEIQHWQFDEPRPEDAAVTSASYTRAIGLRPRPPAVLRQRHRHAARRGARRSRRLRGPALARGLIAAYRSARDGVRVGLPLVF